MNDSNFVLELQHIRKTYPGVVALDDVSLQIKRGEVHALIGENGAGKSTLIKTCTGAIEPDSGKIIINEKEFFAMTPQLSIKNGISVIYQEFTLVGELSVAENIFLGRAIRKGVLIDKKAMISEAAKIFERLNIKIDPKTPVGRLSVGYQQMVEIAKAIQQKAQVLLMDEPSAALTNKEVENMFAVVEKLKEEGVSIIYISHRLDEVFRLSDRITVLRDGKYVSTLNTKSTNVDQLIPLMVGRELTEQYPERKSHIEDISVLEVQHLTGNGDCDISFVVKKGEILGLGGLIGAGRTELAQLIFGLAQKESGKIIFKGKEINPRSPRDAIDQGIALLPEDRKQQGAILTLSIKQNINMPIYQKNSKAFVINRKTENSITERYMDFIKIKAPNSTQLVKNLSGGNQQKVIIAKWLAANCELLIFDEPTRGIDVGAKYEIYKLMNDFVEQGKTILLISSEMEELMGMSDRIIVLSEGQITGELDKHDFNQETIMGYASVEKGR